jgi:hypothetical protein
MYDRFVSLLKQTLEDCLRLTQYTVSQTPCIAYTSRSSSQSSLHRQLGLYDQSVDTSNLVGCTNRHLSAVKINVRCPGSLDWIAFRQNGNVTANRIVVSIVFAKHME